MEEPMYNIPGIEGGAGATKLEDILVVSRERLEILRDECEGIIRDIVDKEPDEVEKKLGFFTLSPGLIALKMSRIAQSPGELIVCGLLSEQACYKLHDRPDQKLMRLLGKGNKGFLGGFDLGSLFEGFDLPPEE